jgi:transposase
MKINAVLWYLSGMSMNRIAFLLRVSAQTVLTWIRGFAKDYCEKLEPTGRTIVLQLDAMWHYLKKKRRKLWIWKALDQETGQLLDWEWGAALLKRRNPIFLILDSKILKKQALRIAR